MCHIKELQQSRVYIIFLSAVDKLVVSAKICMESSPGLELKSAVWTWTIQCLDFDN